MTATAPTASMKLMTGLGLLVGQTQSLALEITSSGFKALLIAITVGDSEDGLMAQDAWNGCKIDTKGIKGKPEKRTGQNPSGRRFVYLPLSAAETQRDVTFQLLLRDFRVATDIGTTRIALYGNTITEPPLCEVSISKSDREPKIQSFSANHYSLTNGAVAELSWKIDMDSSYELVRTKPFEKLASGSGKSGKAENLAAGSYILTLLQGTRIVDTSSLTIHSHDKTGFGNAALDFLGKGSAEILGLYAHPGNLRLYALLRFDASRKEAELWSTINGFSVLKDDWKAETNAKGQTIQIPLDAARRPGAILGNKLFLLGGDCCHPDKPGTAVGYYDFQANVWWTIDARTDSRSWPAAMSERMGHAVIAVPGRDGAKDALWVMGGWTQNGGLCNDIWTFDGETWASLQRAGTAVPCDICLFGAVAMQDTVWTFGGFKTPGGAADPAQFRRIDRAGNVETVSPDMTGQYCASALFSLDDALNLPGGISTFYDKRYIDRTFFVSFERGEYSVQRYNETKSKLDADGGFLQFDYYSIQATVHQRAVFFRTLRPDDRHTPSMVHYLVRVEAKN